MGPPPLPDVIVIHQSEPNFLFLGPTSRTSCSSRVHNKTQTGIIIPYRPTIAATFRTVISSNNSKTPNQNTRNHHCTPSISSFSNKKISINVSKKKKTKIK
ncbi:hypothetical protein PVL29_005714 [Vitis rotundifolia]|uniref:Uncharacterized protein n=1 Tax=Vitis rotundifolia TaxID=103349 RepID=A0AA39A2Z6_VITRO|nr:hypothetical protein PVL29_005714 [Vitis rotundifolia]